MTQPMTQTMQTSQHTAGNNFSADRMAMTEMVETRGNVCVHYWYKMNGGNRHEVAAFVKDGTQWMQVSQERFAVGEKRAVVAWVNDAFAAFSE